MFKLRNIGLTAVVLFNALACTNALANLQPATLFTNLPDNCPTPDAFDIAPDKSLTLSCVNFVNRKLQGELLTINKKGEVSPLATVPTLDKKTKANPMGIAYDPEGNLYVADARGVKNGRVLKLNFNGKKLVSTEIIATGVNPNGLRYHQGAIYITQLTMPKIKNGNSKSAIYRFNASDRNLKMTNTLKDKQLIFHTETKNPDIKFGLDGLAFDTEGNLFTTVLGDGTVYKLTLSQTGEVAKKEVYAQLPNDARIDGMAFDKENNLYLAGFGLNQIYKISSDKKVSLIADYPDNDGSNGGLDQPADLIVFDNKLIISNFDLMVAPGIRNTKHGKPYTLSAIDLNTIK